MDVTGEKCGLVHEAPPTFRRLQRYQNVKLVGTKILLKN